MSTTVKPSSVHEPTTVSAQKQLPTQKYPEEVRPEKFSTKQQVQPPISTRSTFQAAQINISEESVQEINQLINLIIQVRLSAVK